MRNRISLRSVLFFATFAVGVVAAPSFAQTPPAQAAPAAPARTADDVVEKHLAAMGGRDALGKLTSRHGTGSVSITTPAGELGGTIETFSKAPNKTRVAMKLDASALGAGEMIIEQKCDGTSASMFNSMQGEMPITGNQLENMRNALFPSPLLRYKEAGFTVELLPKPADKDAVVLKLTPKAGSVMTLYLDPQTYLITRSMGTINAQGNEITQTSDLSDYRTVDGVKVAFQVVSTSPVQTVTILLKSVEHNTPLDDAMFGKK